jgi:hypothetical protein
MNSTASIKDSSTEMEQGVDVHELLADLEEQLEKSIAIFAPAIAEMKEQFTVAASDIEDECDATKLMVGLDSVQSFLALLEQVCTSLGTTPAAVIEFDGALSDALEALDQSFSRDDTPPAIAATVRSTILPALEKWPAAEVSIRKSYAQA